MEDLDPCFLCIIIKVNMSGKSSERNKQKQIIQRKKNKTKTNMMMTPKESNEIALALITYHHSDHTP